MKQILRRIRKDVKAYGGIVLILLTLWLVCTFFFGSACITVFVTGLPCPGCGMGHAILSILKGNVLLANTYNPSVWIWIAFGVGFFLYRYVFGKEKGPWGWILTLVGLLSVAIYLYRMINLFPSEPPLTYYEGNLFQRMNPEYENLIRALLQY